MSKGRKPKKPQSKKFSALLDRLRRETGTREIAERFLIVCEDNKSAPNYFEALKSRFQLPNAAVEVVGSGDRSSPRQVVERAISRKKAAANRNSGTEPFGQVWCVIDDGDYQEQITQARKQAGGHDVELAITTPCFEYWVLLHFEEYDKSFTSSAKAVDRLRKHLPNYEKGTCDFRKVVGSIRDAAARSKSLRKARLSVYPLPENHNPCSELYRLVDELLPSTDQA